MKYFEIFIGFYIMISFIIFYYYIGIEKEGACVSKPFYVNNLGKKGTEPKIFSTPSGGPNAKSATNMINSYITTMDEIEESMNFIKNIIPVKFNLGVVNNSDADSNITLYGKLPNVFLNFSIKNPPQGDKGVTGKAAPEFGPTGEEGKIGPSGLDGYWGTNKNTLY
jgi:hypothetical protein